MRTLLSLVGVLAVSLQAVAPAASQPIDLSENLTASYAIHDEFDTSELPFYLFALTKKAADLKDPRTQYWCEMMLDASHNLAPGWNRVAMEKNALVQLARVNAVRAMELFQTKVEDPQPNSEGKFPEDVRADAATHIFNDYWSAVGINGLSNIKTQATKIGNTGEYPYRAMGSVIVSIAKLKDKQGANDIFSEAKNFFRDESDKFGNRYKEFESFLEMTESSIVDSELFRSALHIFADRISDAISRGGSNYRVQIVTSKWNFELDDRNKLYLLKAFGMISAADRDLANSLVMQHSYLKKYEKNPKIISGGFIHGDVSPAESARLHSKMYQVSLLTAINDAKDPAEARTMAETLTDTGMRIRGFSSIIPRMVKTNYGIAKSDYLEQLTQLQEVADEVENLTARVALAHAAACVNDDVNNLQILTIGSWDAGMRLIEEDFRQRPDLRLEQLHGFDELTDAVQLAAIAKVDEMTASVHQLPKSRLKAYLLIALSPSPDARPCS